MRMLSVDENHENNEDMDLHQEKGSLNIWTVW